jgi:hypothetical protein
MALIAKIEPPLNIAAGGVAQIHARPYKHATVQTGEDVFIWTSEHSGGHELAAHGVVQTSRIESFANKDGQGSHKELVLEVHILASPPHRPLMLDQIAPDRDSEGGSPEGAFVPVQYKHALNKITSIESGTAEFIRSHFKEE